MSNRMNATGDKRPISSLVIDYTQRVPDWNPAVGLNGVTKIATYDEYGEMAHVPWFAIYVDDKIVWRVNGRYVVEIYYAPTTDHQKGSSNG